MRSDVIRSMNKAVLNVYRREAEKLGIPLQEYLLFLILIMVEEIQFDTESMV